MNYIKGNKEAWEEAIDHRHPNWNEKNYERLLNEKLPFFCTDVIKELKNMDFYEYDGKGFPLSYIIIAEKQ